MPGEILTFRSQQGELLQRDLSFIGPGPTNSLNTTFSSCGLVMSDNVATQLDSFAHISFGAEPTYYNGNKAADVIGDWGALKLGADTVPPSARRRHRRA